MKKFRFTSFSFTILIALLFSFVFFSCASKPAPESADEQGIEAPSENIENVDFETNVISKNENKVILKIDTELMSVSKILEKFLKYGNIIDIEAESIPLEEVIYDIYTK